MKKYTIGLDYGTLSGRAVLVDITTGEECACDALDYAHAVMETALPDGTPLAPQSALQHPQDYIDVLNTVIKNVLRKANVSKDDVIGIGVDFTACTLIPLDAQNVPLCFDERFKSHPHAYAKLWKDHTAQEQASRIIKYAEERGESFLARFGGKLSSEWLFPKMLEICEEDPEVYCAAEKFIEAGDYIITYLTGNDCRSMCQAGYKACWSQKEGYPSKAFWRAVNPNFENALDKLSNNIAPTHHCAGGLTKSVAEAIGLNEGTVVAVANIDAHAALPACGITSAGKMLMIMGTSTCHLMMGEEEHLIDGIAGVVKDGMLEGFYAYEAGQACGGDHFAWAVKHITPKEYWEEAEARGISMHTLLSEKAQKLTVGESGLLALDWFNGNRSVLTDSDLTGMILGLTLTTRAEDIYRALIEATAFGTRKIIETFENGGVRIDELTAAGGMPQKNAFLMQIYADVTGKTIRIAASREACALGSAIYASVAAGAYPTVTDAALAMARFTDTVYTPNGENKKRYDLLYAEYEKLHDYFGKGENNVMKRLLALRQKG